MKTYVIFLLIFALNLKTAFSQNRIVNGMDVDFDKLPLGYMVSLQYQSMHFCSGSIVNEKWALTAAHCFSRVENLKLTAVYGSVDLTSGVRTNVIERTVHETSLRNKGKLSAGHDIAVYKPDWALFAGWGFIKRNSYAYSSAVTTKVLKYVKLPKVDIEECSKIHQIPVAVMKKFYLCFGYNKKKERTGTCGGDSGAPVTNDDGVLIAIHTAGAIPCASRPAIVTPAPMYLDWIKEKTKLG